MAVPCVDGAMYRNDIREVARLFATRHYGRFLIYNLCEDFEESGNGNYDCMLLYDQVWHSTVSFWVCDLCSSFEESGNDKYGCMLLHDRVRLSCLSLGLGGQYLCVESTEGWTVDTLLCCRSRNCLTGTTMCRSSAC